MSFISRLFSSRRGNQIRELAAILQMKYSKKDRYGMVKLLGDFRLFQRGFRKRIKNLLIKEDEFLESRIAIFDYQYSVSGGNHARTYYQTVFFIESKKLALPQFLIRPEHFFHRIGKFLNLTQDIEFEAFPAFSDKFLVQGADPALVKEMVPDRLARFFTIEHKWSLEGINYFLIFYQKNERLPPETIEEFYHKGLEIVEWLQH